VNIRHKCRGGIRITDLPQQAYDAIPCQKTRTNVHFGGPCPNHGQTENEEQHFSFTNNTLEKEG
jgi:hypothetical protein